MEGKGAGVSRTSCETFSFCRSDRARTHAVPVVRNARLTHPRVVDHPANRVLRENEDDDFVFVRPELQGRVNVLRAALCEVDRREALRLVQREVRRGVHLLVVPLVEQVGLGRLQHAPAVK